ncbi:MAG TPA: hypothetical protein VG734_20290 [Lacunisphaera sp.]|nr:hypothetical protein [Lacunisphaera sp.]
MKTKLQLLWSLALAGMILTVPLRATSDVAADWRAELESAQQATGQDVGGRTRADALLRNALNSVRNGLSDETVPAGISGEAAAAHAAFSVLAVLYPGNLTAFEARLAQSLATIDGSPAAIAAGRQWGEHVAATILADQGDAVALNADTFVRAAKAPDVPVILPENIAEQPVLGPGRFLFTVLAGEPGTRGHVDGPAATARFDHPGSIAVDAAGNAYVSELELHTIRKIGPDGTVTTLAGTAGQAGSADGPGGIARFNQPYGIAVDDAGNVFVSDVGNHTIRKIDPTGTVTTLAGKAGEKGHVNGLPGVSRLESPHHLAADDAGNVYFTEWPANGFSPRFRRISPDGLVTQPSITFQTHVAVTSGISYTDSWFFSLAVDHTGNVYAVNSDDFSFVDVVKLTPNAQGDYTGLSLAALPGHPADPLKSNWDWMVSGLGVDGANQVYVKNGFNQIRQYAPDGTGAVYYVGGNHGGYHYDSLAVHPSGLVFTLPEAGSERAGSIEVGLFDPAATGPVIILATGSREEARGASSNFRVWAAGGPGLSYQWYFNSAPIAGATADSFTVDSVQDATAGLYHVVVRDNSGSATSLKQKLTVRPGPSAGTGSSSRAITLPAPATPGGTGGGSLDPATSLALLLLLATAARRRTT